MSGQHAHRRTGQWMPQPNGAIAASAGQQLLRAIGYPGEGADGAGVSGQHPHGFPGLGVPQADRAIVAGAGQQCLVAHRHRAQGVDPVGMPVQHDVFRMGCTDGPHRPIGDRLLALAVAAAQLFACFGDTQQGHALEGRSCQGLRRLPEQTCSLPACRRVRCLRGRHQSPQVSIKRVGVILQKFVDDAATCRMSGQRAQRIVRRCVPLAVDCLYQRTGDGAFIVGRGCDGGPMPAQGLVQCLMEQAKASRRGADVAGFDEEVRRCRPGKAIQPLGGHPFACHGKHHRLPQRQREPRRIRIGERGQQCLR